jgi:hypothetical protein
MAWRVPTIGDLRERVTFVQPLPQMDADGNQAPAVPVSAGDDWARIEELDAEEIATGRSARRQIAVTASARRHPRTWTLRWDGLTGQIGGPSDPPTWPRHAVQRGCPDARSCRPAWRSSGLDACGRRVRC